MVIRKRHTKLLGKIAVALLALSPNLVAGFQEDRLQIPGDFIVARVKAAPDVLNRFPQIQVLGFLKDGTSTGITWQGDATKVTIPTFGLEATDAEKTLKKVALKDKLIFVWGLQDSQKKWISFEEFDHITIQHGAGTAEKDFSGYRSELRFVWVDNGWRISHDGRRSKFEELDIELRARRGSLN